MKEGVGSKTRNMLWTECEYGGLLAYVIVSDGG